MRSIQLIIRLKLMQTVVQINPEYVAAGFIDAVGQVGDQLRFRSAFKVLADADAAADILEIFVIDLPCAAAGFEIFFHAGGCVLLKVCANAGEQVVVRAVEREAIDGFRNAGVKIFHPPVKVVIFHVGDNILRHARGGMVH